MKRHEKCTCGDGPYSVFRGDGEPGCFRCAVDFVIARLGIDPNCECRTADGNLCVKCEVRGLDHEEDGDGPLQAFLNALPPYWDYIRSIAAVAGATVSQTEEGIFHFEKDRNKAALSLLASARTDPLAFDAARYFLAECIRYGQEVPKPLREWGYFAVTGQIERPKAKGKYSEVLIGRDQQIVRLAREVVELFALPPTSSREEHGGSACNAVAEGLRLVRFQPDSYASIKRIWLKRNKPRSEPTYRCPPPAP